ncbi:MAG: hypothetical protein JWR20_1641, partial [Marmoricola sp.]|nr:hypothetical protein [Marmoricola sp.]
VREMEAAVEELFGLPEHQAHAQVLSALRTMGGAGLVRWA